MFDRVLRTDEYIPPVSDKSVRPTENASEPKRGVWQSLPVIQHIRRQAQAAAEGVFDVVGEEPIERVGLMPGQAGEGSGLAIAREAEQQLGHAQQAHVDAQAIGDSAFAIAANDTAPAGRKERRLARGKGGTAADAG